MVLIVPTTSMPQVHPKSGNKNIQKKTWNDSIGIVSQKRIETIVSFQLQKIRLHLEVDATKDPLTNIQSWCVECFPRYLRNARDPNMSLSNTESELTNWRPPGGVPPFSKQRGELRPKYETRHMMGMSTAKWGDVCWLKWLSLAKKKCWMENNKSHARTVFWFHTTAAAVVETTNLKKKNDFKSVV